MTTTAAILRRQDDVTSESVVASLRSCDAFAALSQSEGDDICRRDQEDEHKLAKGIQLALDKGALPKDLKVDPTIQISVVGKTADQVTGELLAQLGVDAAHPSTTGRAVILQGLSGTGKGTTSKKLQDILPKCVVWSNGNVFRTATYLVNKHCEANGLEFSPAVMTPELLRGLFARLSFVDVDGKGNFDVLIDGSLSVSSIANTDLKLPIISSRVPAVAELTQGEVISFASNAVHTLTQAGYNVLLEGRAQTLQYIPTPYRFELVIPDTKVLGQRRAAQRVMAAALPMIADLDDSALVVDKLLDVCASMSPKK